MIVKAKEITKEFFDFPSLRDLILGILQHIKSPTVVGSVFGLVLEPKILGTTQFLELLNLTLAHLVDGIVQIGNAVVQVMTVAGIGEILHSAINERLPHVCTYRFNRIALFLCERLSAQIINAFGSSACFYFDDMTGISIIEHADILMTTADRLLIHAHMLVDTSLVTLIQTSFNGTKHNAMYLLESKAEKTCSLCLIFGREERFYRFFPSAKTSGSLVMPRGQRHS